MKTCNIPPFEKKGSIKLATTEKRRKFFVSERNYHTTVFCTEHLLAIKIKKTQVLMIKPAYLGLSILELSKTVLCES